MKIALSRRLGTDFTTRNWQQAELDWARSDLVRLGKLSARSRKGYWEIPGKETHLKDATVAAKVRDDLLYQISGLGKHLTDLEALLDRATSPNDAKAALEKIEPVYANLGKAIEVLRRHATPVKWGDR